MKRQTDLLFYWVGQAGSCGKGIERCHVGRPKEEGLSQDLLVQSLLGPDFSFLVTEMLLSCW